jgi:hypothetical protein
MLAWQAGGRLPGPGSAEQRAEPRYLRYARAVELPPGSSGEVCAVLDAAVFAHAAGRAANDLRVFGSADLGLPVDVPFTLTENLAQPEDGARATVRDAELRAGGELVFALQMPPRPYSTVQLELAAKNFVGVATVTGEGAGAAKPLGSFPLFDLSGEGLARSTDLALEESEFPVLRVTLRAWRADRLRPLTISPASLSGAAVPPSRQAQTLYTTVAQTSVLATQNGRSSATLALPAHVPVERVSFTPSPQAAGQGEFLRQVTLTAAAEGGSPEVVEGQIWSVARTLPGGERFHRSQLAMDAVLAANLRSAARVTVSYPQPAAAPPLVRSVSLQMRQRSVCFAAQPGQRYTLRYGDAALRAPGSPAGGASSGPAGGESFSQAAWLGPEQINAGYQQRPPEPDAPDRRAAWWIALLALVTALGGWVRHRMRGVGRHGQ